MTDNYDARMLGLIDEFGWAIQGVFPTVKDPDPSHVGFCYTVGLTLSCLPELLIYGLPAKTMQNLLNAGAAWMTAEQRPFDVKQQYEGFLLNHKLAFIEASTDDLNMARRFFGSIHHVSALQMVWPDTNGRFPWDDGFAIDKALQPLRRKG